jgi:DNA-binding MarR family transcriptional regulator
MAEPTPSGTPGLHPALVRNSGYLLSRMGFFAARVFSQRLEAIGLTPRLWGALNVLDADGAVTQQRLGLEIGTDPSSMVATIDELESQGLVERRPHPSDRRAHAIHITPAGRRTLERGRELSKEAQEELLGPLTESERVQLHDFLMRLATAAGGGTHPGLPARPET